ncbi:hypothetical protein Pmar_PMAR021548 [Perkinsus marinus ATCC 50983]|uniref:Uncharacterized protein n=1 Tax=Perkinsus marinus (strain ATCC 50983 / TXsc) TaxID=423536 RepID=C5KNV8_PERM5|nr:hypothetical protein Pmar_PMAR021548 [Perkinsus marinus ATCC 50983]EER13835.1 hypothetical protein Pmar_PMAR021548 [Perkinsus marinus ATCC 50983]|eukprot:XP_002782040.1 hypothetical protein Pmar_PMAR021548 [Perkinsus marinus ATCC 50983]
MFDPAIKLQNLGRLAVIQHYHQLYRHLPHGDLLKRDALISAFTTWVVNANSGPVLESTRRTATRVSAEASAVTCGPSVSSKSQDKLDGAPTRRRSLTDKVLDRSVLPQYLPPDMGNDLVCRVTNEVDKYLSLEAHGTDYQQFWTVLAREEFPLIAHAAVGVQHTLLSTANVESLFSQIREQISVRRTSMECDLIKAAMVTYYARIYWAAQSSHGIQAMDFCSLERLQWNRQLLAQSVDNIHVAVLAGMPN